MRNSRNFFCVLILNSLFLIITASGLYAQSETSLKFNPKDPPETTIPIAPYLTFGAQVELEYRLFRNLKNDGDADGDFSVMEPGLTLAFSFDPSDHVQAFVESKIARIISFDLDDTSEDQMTLEIEQGYLLFKNLYESGLSVQIGRQKFEDEREWLYEEELDAVRLKYDISYYSLDFSVSRLNLVDRDLLNSDEKEKIYNYGFYGKYQTETDDSETILGAFILFRDDRTQDNESPVFLGLHASGDLTENLEYWLEGAYVFGEEGDNDINAVGFDIGMNYQFDILAEPSITLGYAFGTGDKNPDDGTDSNFRQSGLQSNESSFNGVADFKYYGEVFDPELSNLSVFTAGLGVNPTDNSSFDLIYHYYLQHRASELIRDSLISAVPNGVDKSLGSEIDLVLGYEKNDRFYVALRLGYFFPGKAFTSDTDNIFALTFEIQYEF